MNLEESSLPIHNLGNAVAVCFIGFCCLSVADWEEKTSCGIEKDWRVLFIDHFWSVGVFAFDLIFRTLSPWAENHNVSIPANTVGLILPS